jgi:nucleoside-diphosphate-sugar epimerase
MAILLTGATGFLGSNLLARLVARGEEVVVLKRSSSNLARIAAHADRVTLCDADRTPTARLLEENRVELIVHCATNYGRAAVPPSEVIDANLILPLRLLERAAAHGVRGFLNTDTILDKRVSDYSLSKRQFADWLVAFSSRLLCVNVALEHFYGPFDDPSKFTTRMIQELLRGAPRIELTPGQQKRDFIFIDDVVEAFLAILDFMRARPTGLQHFEVGTGEPVPIRAFVERVRALAGNTTTELAFGALPYRPAETMESRADISRLLELGWRPRVSLDEGLERTIRLERGRLDASAT